MEPLGVTLRPEVTLIDRPMIVEASLSEQGRVERVVRMVVREHDVGHVGRSKTESGERIEDGSSTGYQAGVDDDDGVPVLDQSNGGSDPVVGSTEIPLEQHVHRGHDSILEREDATIERTAPVAFLNSRHSQMNVSLIQVPYHAGDDQHPSSSGPGRLLQAGVAGLLERRGHTVRVETADRGGPFRDTASSTAAVNKRVAALVQDAIAAASLPIVIAGSCVTAQGVLGGFNHDECGAVWIDAHADFNTPETAVSGFFPGMSLAVVTGHCYRNYWSQVGDSTPLAEDAIVMFGVRDVWPDAERERLDRSSVRVVEWRGGKPQGDIVASLERLASRVPEVYLHIDFDGFAPEVAPGVVDDPVPGGLSGDDAETIIRATGERLRIKAATLATYTPAFDVEDRTLTLALRLIRVIADCAAAPLENRPDR
jgi:arginase